MCIKMPCMLLMAVAGCSLPGEGGYAILSVSL